MGEKGYSNMSGPGPHPQDQLANVATWSAPTLEQQILRWRRIEQTARELIRIPAIIQALGNNHVGGCSCSLCRLRTDLRER